VMRVQFYIFMSVVEDYENQRRGVTCIFYHVDHAINDWHTVMKNARVRHAVPVRFCGLHLCYNHAEVWSLACKVIGVMNTHNRVRIRAHYGTHMECQYELMTYGIPRSTLPVTPTGELLIDGHLMWLETRKQREKERTIFPITSIVMEESKFDENIGPNPEDVLLGRGKTVVEHPGNTRFRQMIERFMIQYEDAPRLEKTCLAEIIVRMVKESSGRFMKRNEKGAWEEVEDEIARKKVAHAFRNRRVVKM